jgi:ribonuclease HI
MRTLHLPQGDHLKYVLQIHYKVSYNNAEYEALIHGLRIAISLGIKWLIAYGDSKVIIDQVNKMCNIKKDTMDAYCAEVQKLEAHFECMEFHHIYRDNNMAADVLSKLGSKHALVPAARVPPRPTQVLIKLLSDLEPPPGDIPPQDSRDVLMINDEDDWHLDIIAYILEHRVPKGKAEHEKVMRRRANYVVIGIELYRRSASNGMVMKCILRSEGLKLLEEIHGGQYGNHTAFANLEGKAFRSGFYWPITMATRKI